jgi:hypothetical protein
LKPERSKATFSMPACFARAAISLPTAAAAAMLPVPCNEPRMSLLSVDALATTRLPSGAMIWA